ncbi:DNA methyltransferase [Streptococcus phage P0095]|uniref:DNA methyltransferase n=1 Tax=Streptococcus phage P0095 TaxID=1971414 RepID=A0A286QMY0_9CAUD|nr:DNA methyltransferase [Streptococcus phage P0095]ARU13200.1 DNA methyltransferase [Streptococcus phage P0095]
MMQQESQRKKSKKSDKSMLSAQDFRVSLSALLVQDEVLKIQTELSSLKSQGSLPFSNLSIYSSRTSRGLLAMIKGTPLRQSSDHWMSWGMMSNGKCLTARILESPKTENECSLSDILEEQVEDKYFLSLKQDQINQLCN